MIKSLIIGFGIGGILFLSIPLIGNVDLPNFIPLSLITLAIVGIVIEGRR